MVGRQVLVLCNLGSNPSPAAIMNKTILVTGSTGFIGFHLIKVLLERGDQVVGIDNFNSYNYEPQLKEDRNKILEEYPGYKLYRGDINDLELVQKVFQENKIDKVCHLAALAGVRLSVEQPHLYNQTNLIGFGNVIDEAKKAEVENFVYASSSSVYGDLEKEKSEVSDNTDFPVSLYAATKKANEVVAHSYHHLFRLNCTGLRFFTVYGPYGRPDMALAIFTKGILEDQPITVFNHGKMVRDFTYVDDIVSGVVASLDKNYPFEIFNLGCGETIELLDFIKEIEKATGKKAQMNMMPIQAGDVLKSYADIEKSRKMLGYEPQTTVKEGVPKFVSWYRKYYNI